MLRALQACIPALCLLCMLAAATLGSEPRLAAASLTDRSSVNCTCLRIGQFTCASPAIDPATQAEEGCSEATRTVQVPCSPVEGVFCDGQLFDGSTPAFNVSLPCRYTGGKRFDVALLLSVFLGFLGIDRFYLGYPAIGLVKLCTLGGFFIGYLADVLLVLLQVVRPADGSDYIIPYYGPLRVPVTATNETVYL